MGMKRIIREARPADMAAIMDVMAAANLKHRLFLILEVPGFLGFGDAGGGFYGNAEDYGRTIRQAAVHSAGAILKRAVRAEGVVMLGAFHPRCSESVAELYTTNAGDGKYGVRQATFHRIPERISHSNTQAGNGAFDDAAERISLCGNAFQQGIPLRGILFASNFQKLGGNNNIQLLRILLGAVFGIQYLLCNHSCSHYGQGQTAGKMAAAAGIVRKIIFHVRHEIRMPGPGDGRELLVVLALHVGIPENYGKGRAGGVAV